MTCEECEQILLDSSSRIAGKGVAQGVSVLNLATSHAQNCSVCAAKVSEINKLNDALDCLRISTMRTQVPSAVEANLLAAFRKRTAMQRPSVARAFRWNLVWGPAAALLVLAAGLVVYSALRPNHPITAETERQEREHPAPEPMQQVSSDVTPGRNVMASNPSSADGKATIRPRNGVARVGKPRREPMLPQSLPPLPDGVSLNGGISVVRVTLPFSSLVAMGVPVYPDASDRRGTADVARGPFCAVVAIRLVELKPSAN